jgi:hypothetical protein
VLGELLVGVAQFDPADEGRLLVGSQPCERTLIAIERVTTNRLIERRRTVIGGTGRQLGERWAAALAPQLVANPIQDGLSQVREQGPGATDFEAVDLPKRLEEGFLDKVVGVGEVARPPGQAPAGPPPEGRVMADEQGIDGGSVAPARALD